jgi:hypothetical protein
MAAPEMALPLWSVTFPVIAIVCAETLSPITKRRTIATF